MKSELSQLYLISIIYYVQFEYNNKLVGGGGCGKTNVIMKSKECVYRSSNVGIRIMREYIKMSNVIHGKIFYTKNKK
jgi:hypothetical protein